MAESPKYKTRKDTGYTGCDGKRRFKARTSTYTHELGNMPDGGKILAIPNAIALQ